jgi:hypothetical protein
MSSQPARGDDSRRSHRDHLRRAHSSWSVYSTCLRATAHRYLCRLVLDQNRHFHEDWVLGTLHEARTDVSMLLGLIFLLIVGGGTLALDAGYPQGLDPSS